MSPTTFLIAFLEKSDIFQIQLLALLASLVVSLLLNRSLPYFTISAICFLTSLGSLTVQLYKDSIARTSNQIEITTTASFTLLLLSTTIYAIILRSSPIVLRYHAATTLACSVFLTVKAVCILYDAAPPAGVDVSSESLRTPFDVPTAVFEVDRCSLIATGFAAMHLLSALLMLHELSQSSPIEEEEIRSREGEQYSSEKVCTDV